MSEKFTRAEGHLTAFSSKPDQVLVVPPMALAWLTEAEGGKIVVSFEARGHSDATVLLSSCRSVGRLRGHSSSYTVIIGSHRNSCVKIEKNGVVVCQVQTRGGRATLAGSATSSPVKSRVQQLHPMQLDPDVFRPFWVSYGHGEIRIGHGVDDEDAFCAWRDAAGGVDGLDGVVEEEREEREEREQREQREEGEQSEQREMGDLALGGTSVVPPTDSDGPSVFHGGTIKHVGLSSWNTHVGYRNVHVKIVGEETIDGTMDDQMDVDDEDDSGLVCMDFEARGLRGHRPAASTGSLLDSCLHEMERAVAVDTVCGYLIGLDRLANTLHRPSDSFSCARNHIVSFAATHIEELLIRHGEELCMLPSCVMEEVVKHQAVPCSETVVYDAVRRWYEANGPDGGSGDDGSFNILRHVRFPLMTSDELDVLWRQMTLSLHSAPLGWNKVLEGLLEEAIAYHKDRKNMTNLYDPSVFIDGVLDGKLCLPTDTEGILRFKDRSPSGCVNLVYMFDGDTNGVFQFIGTRYGTAPWTNPVAAGLISISSSSPLGRFCDPRALVGRSFSSLNFAGPRRSSDSGVESWWKIDVRHRLRCTRYAMRHDGSNDYLRNWVFQGSVDGVSWTTLDDHKNDHTIRMPAQWASWPVRDLRKQTFRHFRILQTAPNRLAPNPMHLSLDHVELYGDLYLND